MPARNLATAARLSATANQLTRRGRKGQLDEAARLYRQAFHLGDTTAGYNLACSYQNVGEHRTAVQWFRKVLAAGDRSALMPLALAELYGAGTRRNVSAAMKKLEIVARGGSWVAPIEREEAMLLMAQCLREGWLVIRDYSAAQRWLRRAAKVGSAAAAGLLRDLEADYPAGG